jgi:predicted RNA-binding protein with RPS1 domain
MAWGEDIRSRFPDWGTEAALSRWPQIRAALRVGQMVSGTVIARAPFGVWLDIGVGHPALLLVPEMRGAKERRIAFEDYPQIGTSVDAQIVALGDRGEISVSQHPLVLRSEE